MNETEARELLRAAAGTIDVPPGREIVVEQPRRPRWVAPVAAAVAVMVAIGGAVLLIGGRDDGPSPADGAMLRPYVAWKTTDARQDLERAGYEVVIRQETHTCISPGRVIRAEGDGRSITLVSSALGLRPSCPGQTGADTLPLELLDIAAGKAVDEGTFDRAVDVVVNGSRITLSRGQAMDSATWSSSSSALSVFREALADQTMRGQTWSAKFGPIGPACGQDPGLLRYAERDSFQMISVAPGVPGCAAIDVVLDLYDELDNTSADGYGIAAIVVRTGDAASLPPPVVPDVIGTTPAEATQTLENLGAEVKRINLLAECLEDPLTVAKTVPSPGEPLPASGPVEIYVCPAVQSGVTADGRRIAQRFLDFANGLNPAGGIPTDVPVNLYLGGALKKTITAAESSDPASYVVCTEGYAEATCPFSAIETLRRAAGVEIAAASMPNQACANGGVLPSGRVGVGNSVFLNADPDSIDSCVQGFSVQLVFNDVGQITAVNLLLGSP